MPRSRLRGESSRPFLVIAFLAVAVLATGVAARVTVHGGAVPDARPVRTADLVVRDRDDGSVIVLRADGRTVVDVLPPASHGFLRVVLGGLARERRREGAAAPATPFRVTLWSDRRLTLDDAATGRSVELDAFGPDNAGAFARLLDLSSPPAR